MAKSKRSTLRAQWLGQLLRRIREDTGMTTTEAAAYIQRDQSTLSRFESGVYPIRRPDVAALLDLYGVDDKSRRDALLQLAGDQWQKGWWDKYTAEVENWFVDYVWLEDRAEEMRTFDLAPVHGLLQTPAYADAQIRAVDPDAGDDQRKRWLDLRITRQHVLEREKPLNLTCVIDESVIRRPVGGAQIMADQLAYLQSAAKKPNVKVHILPLAAGAHASPEGAFRLLRMHDPFPEVGYIESPAGALYLESTDAERLAARYDRLYQDALSESASVKLISAAEKGFRGEDGSARE